MTAVLGLNHMAIQVEDYEELKDYYNKLQQYYEVDKRCAPSTTA